MSRGWAGSEVEVRGFTEASLGEFLDAGEAALVLDATHPEQQVTWAAWERLEGLIKR